MKNAGKEKDIVYKNIGGVDLKMDVYTPDSLSPDTRLPGVLFIHGGPLAADMQPQPKDWNVYLSYGELAAANGWIGITFNHRYYEDQPFEQSFQDVETAIGYVRENAKALHLDADRLCLWAFSGGGSHLYFALHNRPAYVKCIVAYYAILLDLRQEKELSPASSDDEIRELSLSKYLREGPTVTLPILIARAGLDQPFLNRVTDIFVQEALASNIMLELINYAQGRHGFDIFDDNAQTRAIIAKTVGFIKAQMSE
jgi:dienelactone hydrolase